MTETLQLTSAAITDRGLSDKRPQNEDSYLEMERCGLWAVADGVGGAQAGEVASQMAVEILGEAFANRRPGQDPEDVMREAIVQANHAIHQMASELSQLANMATTLVALHLEGSIATIGHVGDSRLYRVDRDGNLFAETADHSMVAEEVRAGRMTAEQAENHPGRNIISRALGAEATVEVDLRTIMIEPGTAFLLCSDGITRHVSDLEIKGVLTFGGEPEEICNYLKGLCFERGAEDNLTAVVIKLATPRGETEDFLATIPVMETEEPTVATARSAFDQPVTEEDDDEVLLELGPAEPFAVGPFEDETPTIEIDRSVPTHESSPEETIEDPDATDSEPEPAPPPALDNEDFSIFGESSSVGSSPGPENRSSIGSFLIPIFFLLLGSAIGLGVYHFALVQTPVAVPDDKLSVMKTEDIAFSSFEKLRRTVDADPAAFIREVPPAEDAEDFYLIGRARMLTGEFQAARFAFIEAQKLLTRSEPSNTKILIGDIATGLTITNDPILQTRFKQEIDANSKVLMGNTNVNR